MLWFSGYLIMMIFFVVVAILVAITVLIVCYLMPYWWWLDGQNRMGFHLDKKDEHLGWMLLNSTKLYKSWILHRPAF